MKRLTNRWRKHARGKPDITAPEGGQPVEHFDRGWYGDQQVSTIRTPIRGRGSNLLRTYGAPKPGRPGCRWRTNRPSPCNQRSALRLLTERISETIPIAGRRMIYTSGVRGTRTGAGTGWRYRLHSVKFFPATTISLRVETGTQVTIEKEQDSA